MTDRCPVPAAVAAELVRAELVAFDHNLRRWRIAVGARRHTGKAFGLTDPTRLLERVAARITDIEDSA